MFLFTASSDQEEYLVESWKSFTLFLPTLFQFYWIKSDWASVCGCYGCPARFFSESFGTNKLYGEDISGAFTPHRSDSSFQTFQFDSNHNYRRETDPKSWIGSGLVLESDSGLSS